MSYAVCTLLLKLSVLLPLLVVVHSGVSSTENIGNLTKTETKNGSNVTPVSSVLQDVRKSTLLPIRIDRKRESHVVRSKERVKSKLKQTNKRRAKSLGTSDDKKERTAEHSRDDEEEDNNFHDQDNVEVDDKDNEKGQIFKIATGLEEEDYENDPLHDFDEGRCSDDEEEEFPRKFKREHEPKIWDQWGKWSCCSSSCGPGKLTRWRHCVGGGCFSGEKEVQIRTCQIAACLH